MKSEGRMSQLITESKNRETVKFGQLLPIPVPTNVDQHIKLSKLYEKKGFDSIWAADHTLMLPVEGFTPEAWSLLSVCGKETDSVKLGSCVTCLNRYHPAILAQRLATVDHLCKGRVILGLGPGEIMNLKPFGLKRNKSVTKMIEGIEVIRGLWNTKKGGKHFTYNGEYFQLENAFLQINPYHDSSIPIYLGANGPRTRNLTGKLGDGWIPTSETPKLFRKHYEEVKDGAKEVEKSIDKIDPALFIYTAIDKNADRAVKRIKNYGFEIATPGKIMESEHYLDIPKKFESGSYYNKILVTKQYEKERQEYNKLLSDEVIRDFAIVGSPKDAVEKINDFVDSGVRHFILVNAGPRPRFVTDFFSEKIIPHY